jgi:hypothetical protein
MPKAMRDAEATAGGDRSEFSSLENCCRVCTDEVQGQGIHGFYMAPAVYDKLPKHRPEFAPATSPHQPHRSTLLYILCVPTSRRLDLSWYKPRSKHSTPIALLQSGYSVFDCMSQNKPSAVETKSEPRDVADWQSPTAESRSLELMTRRSADLLLRGLGLPAPFSGPDIPIPNEPFAVELSSGTPAIGF